MSQEENSQIEKSSVIPGFGERFLAAFGNLKQSEIASLLKVQPSAITNYTKDRVPKPHILLKVWEFTKCDLHWLLTGDHWPPLPFSVPLENGERQLVEQVAQNNNQPFDQAVRTLILEALKSRGMMRKQIPPTMLILRQDIKLIALSLIGSIKAGQPITYFKESKKVMVADVLLSQGYQSCVLEISGDELADEGFNAGDYLICCDNKQPEDAQVAVVVIDDDKTTVKRLFFQGDNILLRPSNGKGEGDLYDTERVEIVYTVTGVLRDP